MKRVIVYCEGPTEETFVNRVLAPFLYPHEIYLRASSCNGVSKYSIIRRDLNALCKSDPSAIVTTMLDYYALPSDTPRSNSGEGGDIYQKVQRIEAAIQEDIGAPNLIPNLMVHEFEALLFSKPECFSYDTVNEQFLEPLLYCVKNQRGSPPFREAPCAEASRRVCWRTSGGEQAGQQGDQGKADERDTAAGHELLDALGFCLCVIKKQ